MNLALRRTPSRPARFTLALSALAWLFLLGCGGFSSGGAPGITPPEPPEFSKPETQGRVRGMVVVAPGFMAELSRGVVFPSENEGVQGSDEESPKERGRMADALARANDGPLGAADVYAAMTVTLRGTRRQREAEVGEDGSFQVELLPQGQYRVTVRLVDRELASFPALVEERETTGCRLTVLGYDWADLDGDESREDLAVMVEVTGGRKAAGASRAVLPDGSLRATLGSGGTEYLLPGGMVRREGPGSTAAFRRDHDLDGIPDEDDPDYRRLRRKPPVISDEQLLGGKAFPPLVRTASASSASGKGPPQDLILFTAQLARDFVAPAVEVHARLYGSDGDPTVLRLRDDGSAQDLVPAWPGHQPSGDRVAGDGIYSHLMPLDAWSAPALLGRQVVVTAVDAEGRASNRFTFFLYPEDAGPIGRRPSTGIPPDLAAGIRNVEFLGRAGDRGPELTARLEAGDGLAGMVATLRGPREFRRVLAPSLVESSGEWVGYSTRPAPMTADGLYFLVVGIPEGPVFYAGRVLSKESFRPTRTGG